MWKLIWPTHSRAVLVASIGLTVALGIAVSTSWFLRRSFLWAFQVRNLVLMQVYVTEIERYREGTGEYPQSLAVLDLPSWLDREEGHRDEWNHPLFYEATPATFVLVSYGRDGAPDGLNYWELQASRVEPGQRCSWIYSQRPGQQVERTWYCFEWDENHVFCEDICYKWNADQVFSDRGAHRACGK